MNLCSSDVPFSQTNIRKPFKFPPSPGTILFTKPPNLTNLPTYSNRFNILNRANDFKVHWLLESVFLEDRYPLPQG